MSEYISLQNVVKFLEEVDCDFPISLSSKVNIYEYAQKLFENATIKFHIKNNCILGFIAGYTENLENNIAYVTILAVSKKVRGKGIGSKLVKEFIEECNMKNIRAVHLYTHKTNNNAIKMYEKLGFEEYRISNESRKEDLHLIKYI